MAVATEIAETVSIKSTVTYPNRASKILLRVNIHITVPYLYEKREQESIIFGSFLSLVKKKGFQSILKH